MSAHCRLVSRLLEKDIGDDLLGSQTAQERPWVVLPWEDASQDEEGDKPDSSNGGDRDKGSDNARGRVGVLAGGLGGANVGVVALILEDSVLERAKGSVELNVRTAIWRATTLVAFLIVASATEAIIATPLDPKIGVVMCCIGDARGEGCAAVMGVKDVCIVVDRCTRANDDELRFGLGLGRLEGGYEPVQMGGDRHFPAAEMTHWRKQILEECVAESPLDP